MDALVEQGMKDGAFGLSTGLFYVPGTFTPTDEVIELAKVAGRYGGMHESHQRDDASKVIDSVKETIAIGEKRTSADADQPRQGDRRGELGQERRDAAARRRGARPRRGRDDRSVSVHGVEHERLGGAPAGVGARRAAARRQLARLHDPGDAREKQDRDRRDDPRRARRRRSEERAVRELRVRPVAGRQDARRPHASARARRRRSRTPRK